MRSEIRRGGPGDGDTISGVWRICTSVTNGVQAKCMTAGGGATATVALNRASGEWSPSQHICSGLGEAGADSWQPEWTGAAT